MLYPAGVDGCGAPAFSGPLGNWARGFALFAGNAALPEDASMPVRNWRSLLPPPHTSLLVMGGSVQMSITLSGLLSQ